jgi:hypothetical protein
VLKTIHANRRLRKPDLAMVLAVSKSLIIATLYGLLLWTNWTSWTRWT